MKYIKPLIVMSILIVAGTMIIPSLRPKGGDLTIPESSKTAVKSLPYLSWQPAEKAHIDKKGVTIYDQENSYKGLNLYNYDGHPEAYLIDMSGDVLHTWSCPKGKWHHVELLENGDLLVIVRNKSLLKLDWESNIKWTSDKKCHHDVSVAENGDIYTIRWDILDIPHGSATIPIVNDYITILSPEGALRRDISIFELFGSEITKEEREEIRLHLEKMKSEGEKVEVWPQTIFDVFHTNTVEIIESDLEGLASKGDVLICIRNLNIIAIIDVSEEQVAWQLNRNDLEMPHQPSMAHGRILVFDNGNEREYSRVIELNPYTGEKVWEYTTSPKESFFSAIRGGCQRLPNGNILITESDRARVFEVTPAGNIVWEFYGTEVSKLARKRRAIYRMTRFAPNSFASELIGTKQAQTSVDSHPQ